MEWEEGLEDLNQTGYKQSIFCKFKVKYFVILIVLLFFEFSVQANASCMLWQPDPTTGKMDANGFLVSNFVLMEDPARWHPTGSPAWNAANALVQASFMMPDSSGDYADYSWSETFTKISSGPATTSEGYYGYPSIAASVTVSRLYQYIDKKNPTNNITLTQVATYSGGPKWTIVPCTQDKLFIVLSGGSSTMPWHKKLDTNHGYAEANVPYKVTVTDQNGNAKANVAISITTDVTTNSGGHNHTDGRFKGRLEPGTQVSTLNSGNTITNAVTDGNGVFAFTFGSEEASGTHTITANCTGCSAPATATVDVSVKGLMLLDTDPSSYTLRGSTVPHPDNHYFSKTALVKIINFAFQFSHEPISVTPVLRINDSSLSKGGTFDVNQDWTSETNVHGGHRVGVVVDINNYSTPDPDFVIFAKKCCNIQANWHSLGTAPHYHLLLLGEDH